MALRAVDERLAGAQILDGFIQNIRMGRSTIQDRNT
jgi:hypothetical protein